MTVKTFALDQNYFPVNVLRWGTTASLNVGVASASVALPAVTGDIVRISCNQDCYVALGTSGVTATTSDALFLAGVEYIQIASGQTHIAALRAGTDGVLTVTEVY